MTTRFDMCVLSFNILVQIDPHKTINQSIKNVNIELGVYKSDTESFTPLHFLTP